MKKHIIAFCSAVIVTSLTLGLVYSIRYYPEIVGVIVASFVILLIFFIVYFVILSEIS